jgi:hypothetical protein
MPLNNLDALIGMLNGGDGRGVDRFDKTWLRNTIDALDLDILYRFERPDSPMRDEREIQLLLKLQGIAFNWIMDDEDYADFDPADYDDYSDDGDDGDSDNYLDDDDEREDEIDDESDEAEFGDWYRFFGLDDDDSDGSGDFDDSDDEEDREPIPEDLQRQAIELLKPVDISTLDEDKKTCPICYEAFGPSNDPCQTLCEHTFCSDCIRKWIRTGLMCPMCRRDFVDLYVVEEMEDSAEELEAVVERLPSPWWITVLRGD